MIVTELVVKNLFQQLENKHGLKIHIGNANNDNDLISTCLDWDDPDITPSILSIVSTELSIIMDGIHEN